MIPDVIDVRLQELLDNREMSLYKLAKETGVAINNLRRIKKREASQISFDVLEKICIALDCQPGDLLKRL